jgi:microcystin-dependent protein
MGQGLGMTNRILGEKGGEETSNINISQLPPHNHVTQVTSQGTGSISIPVNTTEGDEDESNPSLGFLTNTGNDFFASSSTSGSQYGGSPIPVSISGTQVTTLNTGNGEFISNMQPWLSLRYIIAVDGAFLNNNNGTLNESVGANIYTGNENIVSGTVDKAYGIKVNIQKGNGTINNGYGLFIESIASDNGYGIYQNDATNKNFFSGSVGVGTDNPGEWKLAVNGKIRAKEIKVETGWSDFVFKNDYKLPTLKDVENYIKEKGHLKDIPSAKEVKKNGIFLGEMDSKLLQKIEELTLYTIQQQKEIIGQKQTANKQEEEIKSLKAMNSKLIELQKRLEKLENK